jgi:hypothetical protein
VASETFAVQGAIGEKVILNILKNFISDWFCYFPKNFLKFLKIIFLTRYRHLL